MIFRDPFCPQFQTSASHQVPFCVTKHKKLCRILVVEERDSVVDSLRGQKVVIMSAVPLLSSVISLNFSLSSRVGKMGEMYTSLREAQVLLLINCFEILGRKVLYNFEVQIPQKV